LTFTNSAASANRARDALMALRDLIDEAIRDIDLYEVGEK